MMVGHHTKAFVLLLLVFGAIPEKAEGLKCYTCDNCTNPIESDGKDCGDGESCFNAGSKRGCYPKDKVDCFKTSVGGDCYKPEADGDKAIATKLKECGEEPEGETCVCSADLCNGGGGGSGGGNYSEGRSGPTVEKCYECMGEARSDCDKGENLGGDVMEQPCQQPAYCFLSRDGKGYTKRGCFGGGSMGNCFKKSFAECTSDKDFAKNNDFLKCIGFPPDIPGAEDIKEYCVCKGALCNAASGIKASLLITITICLLIAY